MIYLRGIKYLDLKEILDFVYVGQASLDQNRVNEFLKVATDLEIQGLKQIPQVEGEHVKEDLTEKQIPMQLEYDMKYDEDDIENLELIENKRELDSSTQIEGANDAMESLEEKQENFRNVNMTYWNQM